MSRVFTMNEEQQIKLLSKVDIFESLPEEELRGILRDLLQRNAEINLGGGEVFYTPRQPDGKLFIPSNRAGYESTRWKPQESSPSRC